MNNEREHPSVPELKAQLRDGKINRREFLWTATMLGVSASVAYAFAGKVAGTSLIPEAKAAVPKGGTIRIGMRVFPIEDPHAYAFPAQSNIGRQVFEYLSKTGQDNITRPYLLESWQPSDDLRTWTLNVRKGVTWRNGREFTADDVIWNFQRVLQPETGSSTLGLMKSYLLEEYETGETDDKGKPKKATRLWDANAIERVDSHTVRLNCKAPQLAVPEHLFHYPFGILDPEEDGKFGVGSNGTGAFELVELEVARKAVLRARKDYWGDGPHVDELHFVNLGEDPATALAAVASRQVDGLMNGEPALLEAFRQQPHVDIHSVGTATAPTVRVKMTEKPFDDVRIRLALRKSIDSEQALQVAYRGLGVKGEHHLVAPIHPEYAPLPEWQQDVEGAKALLAEAGYPDGIDLTLDVRSEPRWIVDLVQSLKEQWAEAGIRVDLNVMPVPMYLKVWFTTNFGLTNWRHRPLGFMVHSLAFRTGVPWNESGFSNAEFDEVLSKAEMTVDVEERRALMARLEQILQDEGPAVQPFFLAEYTVYDKRVQGFRLHPTLYIFGNELGIEQS